MSSPDSATDPSESYVFEMTGGALCLDFTNTVGDRPRFENEHLHEYSDLLSWAAQAGALDGSEISRLERYAKTRSKEARRVFERATELRETLYRVFSQLALEAKPDSKDLNVLNRWLSTGMRNLQIEEHDDSFDWSWSGSDAALDRVLWPIARSAADLLTSDEASQIRQCASETCSWLFVDRSRTHRRRWCDMKTCGNRDKARRYYQRQKQENPSASTSDESS